MGKGRFVVEAEGRQPLTFDERGEALKRLAEYEANGVQAKLIDLETDNRSGDGPMFSPPKPLRGW